MSSEIPRKIVVLLLAILVVAFVPRPARAADPFQGEFGFLVGLDRVDADLANGKATTTPLLGLRWASRISRPLNWFIDATHSEYESSPGSDNSKLNEIRTGLERIIPTRTENFSWFISGAVGAADVNNPPPLEDFGRPLVSAGIGLRQLTGGSGIWRAEVRAEQLLGDAGIGGADVTNIQFLVGFSFGLRGKGTEPAPPPKPAPRKAMFEPEKKTLVLEGVNFAFNSDVLTPESYVILDRVVSELKEWPEIRVEVGGHTSSEGDDQYNERLSDLRAKAVRDYFVSRGIAAKRLEAKGYGESRPIADNNTPEGRSKNRRVELRKLD